MASVTLLNQYYEPDRVVTARHAHAIASRLVRDGHRVRAVVGQPSYVAGLPPAPNSEVLDGVEVERIGVGRRRGRERMGTRVEGYVRYLAGAWRRARRIDSDLVICLHNPPLLGLVAADVAKRTGARFIYIVFDIHPDAVVATDFVRLGRASTAGWERANRRMLRAA